MAQPIYTQRLEIREWVEDDWRACHAYGSDSLVVSFMPFGPQSEEDCKAFVADTIKHRRSNPRNQFDFAVVVKGTGQVIGGCDVELRFGDGRRDAEIGYIYRRSAWGQGYATEAVQGLLRFSFDNLGVHRVYATCDVANLASVRVLEKAGMRREGLMVSSFQSHGTWRDHHLYAVVRDDWQAKGSIV